MTDDADGTEDAGLERQSRAGVLNNQGEQDDLCTPLGKYLESPWDLHVDWKVGVALLDSAHDNYAIYQLLHNRDITAVIDRNPRAAGKAVDTNTYKPGAGLTLHAEGVPICRAGLAMRYSGLKGHDLVNSWLPALAFAA